MLPSLRFAAEAPRQRGRLFQGTHLAGAGLELCRGQTLCPYCSEAGCRAIVPICTLLRVTSCRGWRCSITLLAESSPASGPQLSNLAYLAWRVKRQKVRGAQLACRAVRSSIKSSTPGGFALQHCQGRSIAAQGKRTRESIDRWKNRVHAKAQRTSRWQRNETTFTLRLPAPWRLCENCSGFGSTASRAVALLPAALRGSLGWQAGQRVHLASPVRPPGEAAGILRAESVFAVSSRPPWRRCRRSKP